MIAVVTSTEALGACARSARSGCASPRASLAANEGEATDVHSTLSQNRRIGVPGWRPSRWRDQTGAELPRLLRHARRMFRGQPASLGRSCRPGDVGVRRYIGECPPPPSLVRAATGARRSRNP